MCDTGIHQRRYTSAPTVAQSHRSGHGQCYKGTYKRYEGPRFRGQMIEPPSQKLSTNNGETTVMKQGNSAWRALRQNQLTPE